MNNLEEEYKARFKDAQSLEGIDADKLWEQIEGKLPAPDQAMNVPVNKPHADHPTRLLLLLLLLGYCTQKHNLTKLGHSLSPVSIPIVSMGQKNNSEMPYRPDRNKLNDDNKTQAAPHQSTRSKISQRHFHSIQKNRTSIEKNIVLDNIALVNIDPVDSTFLKRTAPEKHIEPKTAIPQPPILPNLAYRILQTSQGTLGLSNKVIAQSSKETPPKPLDKKWQVGLVTGVHRTTPFFNGSSSSTPSFNQTLDKTHSASSGYTIAIELNRKISKRWYLNTGLGYIHTPSKFDFVRKWDTVMYRNQNPNADLIRAKATRTVIHHNQMNFIHLPVAVGMRQTLGKFTLGMQAGVGLNFIFVQEGKSINKNGTIALMSQDLPAYKPFFLSLNAQPFLAYHLKGAMTLRMDYCLRYQHHGSSDFWGVKASSLYSGVGIGGFWAF